MTTYYASVSFGKDSLAMLLYILENDLPLDEVCFYNTGVEFKCIYKNRDKILPILQNKNIKYVELHPDIPFLDKMLHYEFTKRNGTKQNGYKWCGGRCRWGTTMKTLAIKKYQETKDKDYKDYCGIAADEPKRIKENPYKIYPLVNAGMTEKDCLQYCYDRGYTWKENGIDLYEFLDNISCWCCRNKNLKELRFMYHNLPHYWENLKELQSQMPDYPFFDKSDGRAADIFQLEARFDLEDKYIENGENIRGAKFYDEWNTLREKLKN